MTSDELHRLCEVYGYHQIALHLGWDRLALWRKLNGHSPITRDEEAAIRQAVSFFSRPA
jgi:glucose-6-phosphate dehydrogenase assembly protein OpcA